MNPQLTLIRGIPGSGKSTLASELEQNHTNAIWFEADHFWLDTSGNYNFERKRLRDAHQWCQNQCEENLALGKHVIVSNTFTTRWELEPYFAMIQKYEVNPSVILLQNNWGSIHSVPESVIQSMKDRFDYFIEDMFL